MSSVAVVCAPSSDTDPAMSSKDLQARDLTIDCEETSPALQLLRRQEPQSKSQVPLRLRQALSAVPGKASCHPSPRTSGVKRAAAPPASPATARATTAPAVCRPTLQLLPCPASQQLLNSLHSCHPSLVTGKLIRQPSFRKLRQRIAQQQPGTVERKQASSRALVHGQQVAKPNRLLLRVPRIQG
eukprot:CAMPEP_0178440582 /NCGR_PEP_ID=MMETSP0689_2-20121128/36872_1 /TAXON_ID=160604 /ORGANISM="Amphidinium massartii, Strain CS-259" /LENGTH=184 /DNA_ID=CAMNT_0020063399 /DNA_START=298 /DNA_END=852 /DNA_ORIENTATION=+